MVRKNEHDEEVVQPSLIGANSSGILAVDRAETNMDLVSRAVYDADPAYYNAQVDYVIKPTL